MISLKILNLLSRFIGRKTDNKPSYKTRNEYYENEYYQKGAFEFISSYIGAYFVESGHTPEQKKMIAQLKQVLDRHKADPGDQFYSKTKVAFQEVLSTDPKDPRIKKLLEDGFNFWFKDYAVDGMPWLKRLYEEIF